MTFKYVLAACLSVATMAAHAAPITVQFQGVVDSDEAFGFAAGTPVSGQFQYDTADAPFVGPFEFPDPPATLAQYFLNPLDSFRLRVGANDEFHFTRTAISVVDNQLASMEDGQFLEGYGFSHGSVGYEDGVMYLSMVGPSTMRSDATLPTSYVFSEYTHIFGGFAKTTDFGASSLRYSVTSISAVPEASAGWMALAGLGSLALATRVRRRACRLNREAS
jgi:hypothetical protein